MRLLTVISASVLALAAAGTTAAVAAETNNPVTVNDYTPAQKDRALSAVRSQGYTDVGVTMAQDGYLFVKGQKGNQLYRLVVSPEGKVTPSMPYPKAG